MDLAGRVAREIRGDRARGRRRAVYGASAEHRRRAGRYNGPNLLDVRLRAGGRRAHVLRAREPRARDPRRHALHGHDRRAPARDRREERQARLEHDGRELIAALLDHDVAGRREGQGVDRHRRRRLRYTRSDRCVRREERQGSLAHPHDPRSGRARQRDVGRRLVEGRRRGGLERGRVRPRDEPRVLRHR